MRVSRTSLRALTLTILAAGCLALGAAAATGPARPVDTGLPTVSGTVAVGQSLTAGSGSWSGTTPIQFFYQWARSNAKNGFDPIPGATQQQYTVTSADVGHMLYVQVKAKNTAGVAWADSKPTATVGAAPISAVMQVSSISLPDRLVISGLAFAPAPPASSGQTPIQARFRVTDSAGHPVQGALVYAAGLPYGWANNAAEQSTGADGWATVTITPTTRVPATAKHIVMFVRARKPGGSVLAGVSTRRLVQASLFAV